MSRAKYKSLDRANAEINRLRLMTGSIMDQWEADACTLARLKAVAQPFARMADALGGIPGDSVLLSWDAGAIIVTAGDVRALRAALREPTP